MKAYERDQKILNLLADGEDWHTKDWPITFAKDLT